MKNYTKIDIGKLDALGDYTFQPSQSFKLEGKVFVKEDLGLTGAEISFNTMKPQTSIPFLHKHHNNEEVYIAISGNGQLLLDGEYVDLKEGSLVRVSKDAERAIRNNSDNPFTFIVFQSPENGLENGTVSDGYATENKPNWK